MSNGANCLNEVASSSDATISGGGSFSPAPTPAPAAKVIDMNAEKKAVPVILSAPVYNSCLLLCTTRARGTCTSCRRRRSKPSMISRCRPVFGGEGRVKPRLCTRLACTSNRPTRKRHLEVLLLSKRILPSAEDGDPLQRPRPRKRQQVTF